MDYLARQPNHPLTVRLAGWLQSIDPLPPEAVEPIAATLFTADGRPAHPVAVDRLPTTGPGAERTAQLVVRYLGSGGGDLPPAFGEVAELAGKLGPAAKPAAPALRRGLKGRPAHEVVSTADALLRVVPGDPEAVAALLTIAHSNDPEAYAAVLPLARLGASGGPIVPELVRMVEGGLALGGAGFGSWEAAVRVLGDLGPCARDALPVLRRGMNLPPGDPATADVIADCTLAVGLIDPAETASVVSRLTATLASGRALGQPGRGMGRRRDTPPGRNAAVALCRLGAAARPAVPELIAYARFDPDATPWIAVGVARIAPDRHAEMLGLLAEGWWHARESPPELAYPGPILFAVESLDHPTRAVRKAAWNLLTVTGIPPAYRDRVRAMAARGLDRLPSRLLDVALARGNRQAPPPPEILGEVQAWERMHRRRTLQARLAQLTRPQIEHPVRSTGWTWEQVAKTDRVSLRKYLPDLLRATDQAQDGDDASDPFGVAETRRVRALARAAPDCVGPLVERLGPDRPARVRARAALALKAAGKEAVVAAPGLRRALGDPDVWVRLLVAEAVCAIESPPPTEAVLALAALVRTQTPDAPAPLAHLRQTPEGRPVWVSGRAMDALRALGPAAKPAADELTKEPVLKANPWFAESLLGADPARAPELVGVLVGQLETRRANPAPLIRATIREDTAYKALDRIPRSDGPAGRVLAAALARHPDDELTAVLARALRRVDPTAAKSAGVR